MAHATLLRQPAAATDAAGTVPATPAKLLRTAQWGALVAALGVVAAATLTPNGAGWAWGSPLVELRWYAAGLGSAATLLQLVGNLALLAVPAVIVVALQPGLGRSGRLLAAALVMGSGIELLQWALPLGRVVSPLDAVLNAAGAAAAGLLFARVQRARRGATSCRSDASWSSDTSWSTDDRRGRAPVERAGQGAPQGRHSPPADPGHDGRIA